MKDNIFINGKLEPDDFDEICNQCMLQYGGLCPFDVYDWTLNWDFDCPYLIDSTCN